MGFLILACMFGILAIMFLISAISSLNVQKLNDGNESELNKSMDRLGIKIDTLQKSNYYLKNQNNELEFENNKLTKQLNYLRKRNRGIV